MIRYGKMLYGIGKSFFGLISLSSVRKEEEGSRGSRQQERAGNITPFQD